MRAEQKIYEENHGKMSAPSSSVGDFSVKTDGAEMTLTKQFGNEK